MLITIDTEKSSPAEIRRAVRILVALEDSTEGIRSIIRELYGILAAKVNEERRRYRELVRKHARANLGKSGAARRGTEAGVASSGGVFQGVEIG